MGSLEKTRYHGYDFHPDPDQVKPDHFNLSVGVMPFRNTPVRPLTPAESELIRPLLDHVSEVFCGGDQALFDYVINWVAGPCQHPGVKNNSALILTGPQGALLSPLGCLPPEPDPAC